MSEGLVTVSYLGAIILFILTLGGLSHQETARKGNIYGIIGMTIAVLATIFGPQVTTNIHLIIIAMLIGGSIGIILARKVAMTDMPQMVAALNSMGGLSAVFVAWAAFLSPESFGLLIDGYIQSLIHI